MFCWLVYGFDTLREPRRLSAHLGCAKARDGKLDTGDLAELDVPNFRHRWCCNGQDLNIRSALTHHERHRVDLETDVPLDCDHNHHELRSHLVLAVDIPAMPPATAPVGSSN